MGFVAPIVILPLDAATAEETARQTATAAAHSTADTPTVRVSPGPTGARRLVLDATETPRWTDATPRRREGDGPTGDVAVDEAYDGLGASYRFFREVFGRDSVDDNGMELIAVVHYGTAYANAFWTGELFVFGNGDGQIVLRPTAGVDVIGHEFAIAVLQFAAGFRNGGQSGAIIQHLADVFGVLAKQYHLRQAAAAADWLVGADVAGPKLGPALRSMKAPGTANPYDKQPAHMDGFVNLPDDDDPRNDNGGVHINNGILNRAFYLAATALGGYAWERAGRTWYEAMTDRRVTRDPTFTLFAAATCRAAEKLYGKNGEEVTEVRRAWAEVGVPVPARQAAHRRASPRGSGRRSRSSGPTDAGGSATPDT